MDFHLVVGLGNLGKLGFYAEQNFKVIARVLFDEREVLRYLARREGDIIAGPNQ